MNLTKVIPNSISSKVARQALLGKKNSPTILFGLGVAGTIGSTVLACRATLKMDQVLDHMEDNLEIAKTMQDREYSEHDRQSDITLIYIQTAVKIGTLYLPAIGLGAASIGALTASHNILQKRNAALTAAYIAVDSAFKEYRERVVDKYGEEEDLKLRYEMEVAEVENEQGKKVKVLQAAPGAASMYAKFFDQYNPNWNKEAEYNLLFIRCQQNWANDMLKSRGHIFLNDVYDALGIERSSAGAVVGWIVSDKGDNYVDFGMYDDTTNSRDFINGREASILLDFNVDGIIYDKIDEYKRGEIGWQS